MVQFEVTDQPQIAQKWAFLCATAKSKKAFDNGMQSATSSRVEESALARMTLLSGMATLPPSSNQWNQGEPISRGAPQGFNSRNDEANTRTGYRQNRKMRGRWRQMEQLGG